MGTSSYHASTVGLIRNLRTGSITPQFHMVLDDWFETVYSDQDQEPANWVKMVLVQSEMVQLDPATSMDLHEEWLSQE